MPSELSLSFHPGADLGEACRVCGCTEWTACVGEDGTACHWTEPDLCSACASGEPAVEVTLCRIPRNPETRQALEYLVQAAARVLVSQPARREARRAKPEFQGLHETRNTRHESRLLRGPHGV